jgi:hypothetical protein
MALKRRFQNDDELALLVKKKKIKEYDYFVFYDSKSYSYDGLLFLKSPEGAVDIKYVARKMTYTPNANLVLPRHSTINNQIGILVYNSHTVYMKITTIV